MLKDSNTAHLKEMFISYVRINLYNKSQHYLQQVISSGFISLIVVNQTDVTDRQSHLSRTRRP